MKFLSPIYRFLSIAETRQQAIMMRTSILIALLILTWGSLNAQECKPLEDIAALERQHFHSHIDFQTNRLTQSYDIKYHRLEWEVDPAVRFIKGVVTTSLIPVVDGLDVLYFDMSDRLKVEEITLDGQVVSHRFIDEHTLEVDLPRAYNIGEVVIPKISYAGIPTDTGFGSFRVSEHNGVPVLWTLSEPYGARDWWPCKQDLHDKIDSVDIIVTIPKGYKVASNGVLMSVTNDITHSVYHWKHGYPIAAYLVAIGVTNYATYSDYVNLGNGDTLEVLNYVYPEDLDQAMADTRYVVDMILLFNRLFGLYPFADEKYGHAQFGRGGGMEHQTMSFMTTFGFELQAHELAHQWFGDKVTCGSWQDIWLNEGFATYLTGIAIENLSPAYWKGWKSGNLARIVSQPDGSVFVIDTTDLGRIFSGRLSYSKGAYVLHMLRWIMGDDAFFLGCRNYLEDPHVAYGYARTKDLIEHLELVHGGDLDYFFEDWIYGEGHPSFALEWKKEGDSLIVKLDQTPSHSSVDFFELPVPIHIHGEGQEMVEVLENTTNGQRFILEVPMDIDSITIDEDLWLISADNEVIENMGTATTDAVSARFQIFPNPVRSQINLRNHSGRPAQFKIWSSDSRQVLSGDLATELEIPTDDWRPGVYVLLVIQQDHSQVFRLIKD